MCEAGIGVSEFRKNPFSPWEKHIHMEEKVHKWNGPTIKRSEMGEFGNKKDGFTYAERKVTYSPKIMCGRCYNKYKHLK